MSDTELEGGTLWQWDTGRTVEVTDAHAGDVMDFARNGMDEALTVAISDDGEALAYIKEH